MDKRHKLIKAGPGAGKTTEVVNNVIKNLPNLSPKRFMAVITYTNAATQNIQKKVQRRLTIPPNLFIGTIHSFLIRFIVQPYAHLYNFSPIEKSYIDEVYSFRWDEAGKEKGRVKAEELAKKGLITYDKVLEIAYKILEKSPGLKNIITYRMEYLFIDEYQDARLYQHLIFKSFLREDNYVYFVGDAWQSIFSFQYDNSQLRDEPKPDNFLNTPINQLELSNLVEVEKNVSNFRSTSHIVKFLNQFNQKLQEEKEELATDIPVHFITGKNKDEIIKTFFDLCNQFNIKQENKINDKMILSRKWSLFDDVKNITLKKISNQDEKASSNFNDFSRCILGILGYSERELFQKKKVEKIKFRKFVFESLFEIKKLQETSNEIKELKRYNDKPLQEFIIAKWNKIFPYINPRNATTKEVRFHGTLIKFINKSIEKQSGYHAYCSTIHGAKGLEANSVLVIADKGGNYKNPIRASVQLEKWLEIDKYQDDDETRCGFVAFSRARKFLAIACLEDINTKLLGKMGQLNIVIV
jgi:DNA helicase-2/ATP-dependent DNA helicase PcrA